MANNIYDYSYQMRRNLQKKISFILLFVFCIFIVVSVISTFFIYSVFIKSDSMSPSLEENNIVFVSPFVSPANPIFADKNILERGQVVQLKPLENKELSAFKTLLDKIVLFFTFQKMSPFSDSINMTNSPLIRRVVGLPGDTVYVKDYIVYIKPANSSHFLTEFEVCKKKYDIIAENMNSNEKNIDLLKDCKEILLDKNEYFVISDNRISSIDSRLWGKVNANQINGKVLIRYFPLNKISAF
jgi:signal peptidase I